MATSRLRFELTPNHDLQETLPNDENATSLRLLVSLQFSLDENQNIQLKNLPPPHYFLFSH